MIPQSQPVLDTLASLRRIKRAAERGRARVRFMLQRRTPLEVLTEAQVARYREDGCLLVSGLVPGDVIRAAEEAMWQELGASSQARETWAILGPHPHILRDERLVATYTDAVLAAAAQLVGEHVSGFARPGWAFTINRVPRPGEWRPNGAHLDYSLAAMRHRTFPRPFRIGAMTYLTDVPRHGGGTIVWRGSHVKVEALAEGDPGKYKYMSTLGADLGRLDLGPAVELTPSRGDVLFLHPLCVHASSDNVSDHPRLAINHKW